MNNCWLHESRCDVKERVNNARMLKREYTSCYCNFTPLRPYTHVFQRVWNSNLAEVRVCDSLLLHGALMVLSLDKIKYTKSCQNYCKWLIFCFFLNFVNMDSLRFPLVNTWIIMKNVTSNYFNLVAQEKPLVFYCFSYVTEDDLCCMLIPASTFPKQQTSMRNKWLNKLEPKSRLQI